MAVPMSRSFQKKVLKKPAVGESQGEKTRGAEKKLGEAINKFISMAEASKLQQPELSVEKKAEHEVCTLPCTAVLLHAYACRHICVQNMCYGVCALHLLRALQPCHPRVAAAVH